MVKLGLVTVLYNSNDVLEGFFKSLALQDYHNYHLYIIDNSSNDFTDDLIKKLAAIYPLPGFTHVKNTTNNGVAKGNNQGIAMALNAGCDYIMLVNNDIEFLQPGLITTMAETAVQQNENLIIPKIFYYGSRVIWMAGGKLLPYRGYTIHIGEDKEDSATYNNKAYFDYAPTCFLLVSKKVFAEVGLMDEDYFVYFDDTDFIYRAGRKGYRVLYLPDLEVFHKVSSSTGGNESLFSLYYANRNRLLFIRKNLKSYIKWIALTYTIATRFVVMLRLEKTQQSKLWAAIKDGLTM